MIELRELREEASSLDALRDEWGALGAASGSIFSTWDWAECWYRHLGQGRPLLVRTWRDRDDRLRVVVPLYLWRRRMLSVARFLGHDQGDELGPVAAPADAPVAAEALRASVAHLAVDVVLAEQLPGGQDWATALGGRTWRVESSPVLRWREGWSAFCDARSRNFREQIRRRERRLRDRYDVRFRLTTKPERLDADLDALFSLHAARWGRPTDFTPQAFHREIAHRALSRGWLRLWILELDDTPVAVWYGFRVGTVEAYYQAGRDPRFDHDSVGFVLLSHTIRSALDDGVHEYRFLRGPEPYKSRFATADSGLDTIAVARSSLGLAGIAAGLEAKRMRPWLTRSADRARRRE
jgi:CelD/BcsL family acetyltransferase involved in cellulose biosynthesis